MIKGAAMIKLLVLAALVLMATGCGPAGFVTEDTHKSLKDVDAFTWLVRSNATGRCYTAVYHEPHWFSNQYWELAQVPCPPELSNP